MRRHDPPRAGAAVNGAGVVGELHGRNAANIYPFPVPSKYQFDTDLIVAGRFLTKLAPDGLITYQTFDDGPDKRTELAKIRHGSLDRHADELIWLNGKRAGIFVMVNEGDGRGRKAHNVVAVRALFVDLDHASLEPVLASEATPHLVVESSPGRWHCYWITSDCPRHKFPPIQRALAARFGGDNVHDLPRVLQIPGFWHRKAAPFRSALIIERAHIAPYQVGDLVEKLRLREFVPAPRPVMPASSYTPIRYDATNLHVYVQAALDGAAAAIASAPNERQNPTLNRECFSIGTFVAGKVLPERLARDVLMAAALKMTNYKPDPWLREQIDDMIDRGFADAQSRPRGVPK